MNMDLADIAGYEYLRPLVTGWLAKIEGALKSRQRKKWKDIADECKMFFSRSAAAMWDSDYSKKFWRNVKAPKFRITINKAFEYVAVVGPNLLWDIPYRTVTPKKILEIPQELFPDEQSQQIYQILSQKSGVEHAQDKMRAHLMQTWLNYTPREMPGGGMEVHNELTVVDAMLSGFGCTWPAIYKFPSSERTLTGCFRKPPEDLIVDPDFKTLQQAKYVALRHTEPHWEVERRFGLPSGSLKDKATLESAWHYSELKATEDTGTGERRSGKTNDLVVWYEIWSKLGVGARMTGMPSFLKNHLEEVVGDYAYVCICPDCPFPLNCQSDKMRQGATDEEIRSFFEWPVPLWTDDRWPFEMLWFYQDPESPYPIPPLAPALGELKFLNFLVPWLCNRIYSSSRDFWAVVGGHFDEYKKYLDDGEDQVVFPLPPGAEDVRTQIMTLQQPETRADVWKIFELVSTLFDKRVGLVEGAYGRNEDGTQNRTAEETQAKQQAIGVRPQYMQKQVIGWQSRIASVEAMLSWLFVKSTDVMPLLGEAGGFLWREHIENADHEEVVRQMGYEISAASVRRPNRDRDIANLNEYSARLLPVMQSYGELTQDYTPVNGLSKRWGELHDMDMEEMYFPQKDPNAPEVQMQQAQQQAELQKTQAEAQKLQSEAQQNPSVLKAQELQMKGQIDQQKMAMDMQKTEAELKADLLRLQMEIAAKQAELQMKAQEHQQDMAFDREKQTVDLQVKQATGAQQIQMGQQQMALQKEKAATDIAVSKASAKNKIDTTREQGKAKVAATKAMAKAKPKTESKK